MWKIELVLTHDSDGVYFWWFLIFAWQTIQNKFEEHSSIAKNWKEVQDCSNLSNLIKYGVRNK